MAIQAAYIGVEEKSYKQVNDLIKKQFREILLVAHMDNPDENLELIYHLNLDLVIMDIDLPKGEDRDIVHLIPEKYADKTIVISRDPLKAVACMHKGILDFIEKPITAEHFKQILMHYKHHLEHEHALNSIVHFDRIIVNRHDKAYLLELENILYFEADGPYTNIKITGDKKIGSSKPLGYYRDLLETKKNFVAVNRSTLINIQNIREIVKEEGEGTVILKDSSRLEVSRASKNRLMQVLYDLQDNSL
ncbi:MAG: LytTR family transcriptional regulator DNA-binding domain-containing protein [Bacteroidetes bacterium]|nr:LytTR family transcriptional regulator DNA-binding domain-containing protein [Bacteroidota bacterium]